MILGTINLFLMCDPENTEEISKLNSERITNVMIK